MLNFNDAVMCHGSHQQLGLWRVAKDTGDDFNPSFNVIEGCCLDAVWKTHNPIACAHWKSSGQRLQSNHRLAFKSGWDEKD